MKKTIYNAFFLAILFHNGLHGSLNQYEQNELIWAGITNAVIVDKNFPKTLNYDSHSAKIDEIIKRHLDTILFRRLPMNYGKSNKHLRDKKAFNATQDTLVNIIIASIKRYALSLEHHQQTKKPEPTPEELAQAAEKFAAAAVAADKAMQDFLAEEAQKRSIAGAAKKNNGKSKKPKNKK